jgi:Domain of unknown function (DUF1772)
LNRSLESMLRFVNLTTSGLLAGSLGFGKAALVPGWQDELPRERKPSDTPQSTAYFNAIGPVALASAITIAVASRGHSSTRRILDAASALGLAGVLATTVMVTVPINKRLEAQPAADYPSDHSGTMVRNWSRAHAVRTTLGVSAFLLAVASNFADGRQA